jgi:hypothetical protein
MIRKIATAAVYADDQRKAVEFWTKQAGFKVHREKAMGHQASWIEVGPSARGVVSRHLSKVDDAGLGRAKALDGVRV